MVMTMNKRTIYTLPKLRIPQKARIFGKFLYLFLIFSDMQILFILLSLFSTTLCAQAAFNAPEVDAIAYDDSGNYTFFQK